MFLESLESEYEKIDESYDDVYDMIEEEYGEDYARMQEELDLSDDEREAIVENIVKRVNSKGQVRRTKSRNVRSRRAVLTTGMSKAKLRLRARKSKLTRKRNPTAVRKGIRKSRKAKRRRSQMGIKNNR